MHIDRDYNLKLWTRMAFGGCPVPLTQRVFISKYQQVGVIFRTSDSIDSLGRLDSLNRVIFGPGVNSNAAVNTTSQGKTACGVVTPPSHR